MVGIIDEAFMSRIHVSMQYPRIDLETTLKIWENFLQRFKLEYASKGVEAQVESHKILRFAKEHYQKNSGSMSTWNGWQISNAFQTAIALGETERSLEDTNSIVLRVGYFEELAGIDPLDDSEDSDTGSAGSHINPSTVFAPTRRQYSYLS